MVLVRRVPGRRRGPFGLAQVASGCGAVSPSGRRRRHWRKMRRLWPADSLPIQGQRRRRPPALTARGRPLAPAVHRRQVATVHPRPARRRPKTLASDGFDHAAEAAGDAMVELRSGRAGGGGSPRTCLDREGRLEVRDALVRRDLGLARREAHEPAATRCAGPGRRPRPEEPLPPPWG